MDDIKKLEGKLNKIKALLDGTVGAEHLQIQDTYERLLKKYEELKSGDVEIHKSYKKFPVKGFMEHSLLEVIIIMVTGSDLYDDLISNDDAHINYIGVELSDIEEEQIKLYYNYYLPLLTTEVHSYIAAFALKNQIVPDKEFEPHYKDVTSESTLSKISNLMTDITKHDKPKV